MNHVNCVCLFICPFDGVSPGSPPYLADSWSSIDLQDLCALFHFVSAMHNLVGVTFVDD